MSRIRILGIFIFLAVFVSGCEDTKTSEGLLGLWKCHEIRSNNSSLVYNVSIDQFWTDSSYVIYNMYNLRMDFEVYVQLSRDSIFSFLGTNNDQHFFSGTGVYRPSLETIEWNYSVIGNGVNELVVAATFRKD